MLRRYVSLLGGIAVLVAGCGAPGGPVRQGAEPVAEPVVVRPVVVAERGPEEMGRAILLLKEKYYPQAEANFEEILKVRADIPEAYFNLAWVRYQMGKYAGVTEAIRGGLERRPNEIAAYALLALSERELGQFADAEASYRAGLALAPDDQRMLLNLGILYDLYLLKPQLALQQYRRYQSLQKVPDTKVAGWIAVLERKEAK